MACIECIFYMYALKQLMVSQDIECYRWVFHRAPFMKDSASIKVTKHVQISSTFKQQDFNFFHICTSNLNCIHLPLKKNYVIYYSNSLNPINYHLEVSHRPSKQFQLQRNAMKLKHGHSRQQKYEKRDCVVIVPQINSIQQI